MPEVDLLPTVVLEHARTGAPMVVNLKNYLAEKDGRFANWRLLAHGDRMDPIYPPQTETELLGADANAATSRTLDVSSEKAASARRRSRRRA